MSELQTLAIALEQGRHAANLLELGSNLSGSMKGGRLFLTHAVTPMTPEQERLLVPLACFGEDIDRLRAELVQIKQGLLRSDLDKELGKAGTSELLIELGQPATHVLEMHRKVGATLSLVGVREGRGMRKLGSVAESLLCAAHQPVWLKCSRRTALPKKVLVGTDLGEGAGAALEQALEFSARIGAELVPIYVFDSSAFPFGAGGNPPVLSARVRKEVRRRFTQISSGLNVSFSAKEELKQKLAPLVIAEGPSVQTLQAQAAEVEAELIIVARTSFERPVGEIGRVSEALARTSEVDVLVLPYGGEKA